MPEADFYIGTNDDKNIIADTLRDSAGNAVDIAAGTVLLTVTPMSGGSAILLDHAATNAQVGDGSDGTKGHVKYTWQAADTALDGYYLGRWKVHYQAGGVQSFPNTGYFLIAISPDAPTAPGTDYRTSYVTVEEIKASFEITASFPDKDLKDAILAASRGIDRVCKRRFWLDANNTSVRVYTPRSLRLVPIDDCVDIQRVDIDRTATGTFSETWTFDRDYVLEPANAAADNKPYEWLRARFSRRWFPAEYEHCVKVTGRFGWSYVPAEVKEAARILAGKLYVRKRSAPLGILTVNSDSGVAMRIARDDPDVMFLLNDLTRRQML